MVLKALIIISIMLQTLATIAAIRLVRLTKYNSIWILLIIGMAAMSVTRYGQYVQTFVDDSTAKAPNELYIWLDAVASLCIAVGVLYAHKLFTYIGHLDHQRKLTNKRILTAVLRTEEKFRSRYSRELHDGMGPLLSSAKMSMSVLAKRAEDEENRELIASTSAVIDEAIRSTGAQRLRSGARYHQFHQQKPSVAHNRNAFRYQPAQGAFRPRYRGDTLSCHLRADQQLAQTLGLHQNRARPATCL